MMVDIVINELKAYAKALREEDREIYQDVLKLALKKVGAISYTSSINVWALVLLSIILEQEKKIRKNESLVNGFLQERGQDSLMDKN